MNELSKKDKGLKKRSKMKLKVLERKSSVSNSKEKKSLIVPSRKRRRLFKNVRKKPNELDKRKKGLKSRI